MKNFFMMIAGFLLLALVLPVPAMAADRVLLGEQIVSDRAEYDTFQVGHDRGLFAGLQVKVRGSKVEFKRIVIHFENDEKQVLDSNRVLGKGMTSRVLDLDGGKRFIEKVVFYYEARSPGWKSARVILWGVR